MQRSIVECTCAITRPAAALYSLFDFAETRTIQITASKLQPPKSPGEPASQKQCIRSTPTANSQRAVMLQKREAQHHYIHKMQLIRNVNFFFLRIEIFVINPAKQILRELKIVIA